MLWEGPVTVLVDGLLPEYAPYLGFPLTKALLSQTP